MFLMNKMQKMRLDQLLVARDLVESREKAQRLIRAGLVLVNDRPASKPGFRYAADCLLRLKAQERFVSRGGEKLEGAFKQFNLNVEGLIALDVGSSTGGFTDCLLQHGAKKVYAVDVGTAQLHWKLRDDPRVVVMEQFNARYLGADDLPEQPQMAVTDVSFISLTKILPPIVSVLESGRAIIALIKPQFEAGREQVGRGGVVRDESIRREVVDKIRLFCEDELNLSNCGLCESPLKGPAGNVEYLSYWIKS